MRASLALLVALAGCADDEPVADPYKCIAQGGGACFELPTKPIAAADAMGNAVSPVLDCEPYQRTTSTMPITVSGKTVNGLNQAMVPGVRVEVFSDLAMLEPLGETMSDDMASYTLTIDALPNLVFARTSADGFLPIAFTYQRIDVTTTPHEDLPMETLTRANVASALELVGDEFFEGKSQIAGIAYDCNRNHLVNVVANIAPQTGSNGTRLYVDGVKTYYAIEGNAPVLGRRTQLMQTTSSGGFAASNLSAGKHYVQLWGFPSEAALMMGGKGLVMVGEVEVLVPSGENGLVVPVDSRIAN